MRRTAKTVDLNVATATTAYVCKFITGNGETHVSIKTNIENLQFTKPRVGRTTRSEYS